MKTKTLYQVRYFNGAEYSKPVGQKGILRDYKTARRLASRLKKYGIEAISVPVKVTVWV